MLTGRQLSSPIPGKWPSAHWTHYKMLLRDKPGMDRSSKQPEKPTVGLRAFKAPTKD